MSPGEQSSTCRASTLRGTAERTEFDLPVPDGARALPKPDVRPQLRELLAWYDDVLGRIPAGALVAPGVAERLSEERDFSARLLELLDAGEESSQATE
jgi:hypothetical protein